MALLSKKQRQHLGGAYAYKTAPFAHQRQAFEQSWMEPHYALLMEQGTGKSKVVIDTAAHLYERREIDSLIVIAPKGMYENWLIEPDGEIQTHLPDRIPRRTMLWRNKVSQVGYRDALLALDRPFNGLTVLVVNIESLSIKQSKAAQYLEWFIESHKCLLVVDESSTIKNAASTRTERVTDIGRLAHVKYRRILTGTPVTNNPLDVWAQFEFLEHGYFGIKSFSAFRNRYAHTTLERLPGRKPFIKIVGFQRTEELQAHVARKSYRVLKDDCLDLPPKVYHRYAFEMTDEQHACYVRMREMAIMELEDAERTVGITAPLVITKRMKLRQIACGFVKDEEGKEHNLLPKVNPRLDALMDCIESTDGKIIIWSSFQFCLKLIAKHLRSIYGPSAVGEYHGGIAQDERQSYLSAFKQPKNLLRYLVANPATGKFGLTLTVAQSSIYYNNNDNLEDRLQSEDRLHRIGQKGTVNITDIGDWSTIDRLILKSLRAKVDMAATITGDNWREFL